MAKVNAYVSFDGNGREAMNFYKECFGGELKIQTVGGSPVENQMPPEFKDRIMHSVLENDGVVLMASELVPTKLVEGNNITLCINCTSDQEIKTLFSKLSTGAKAKKDLEDTFWGATFGEITDKFGIRWMLNYEKPKK